MQCTQHSPHVSEEKPLTCVHATLSHHTRHGIAYISTEYIFLAIKIIPTFSPIHLLSRIFFWFSLQANDTAGVLNYTSRKYFLQPNEKTLLLHMTIFWSSSGRSVAISSNCRRRHRLHRKDAIVMKNHQIDTPQVK